MEPHTLFLAWQGESATREWFPIGRLDADVEAPLYRFRYTGGAKRAQSETGFPPLWDFPELETEYRASELFPLFQNRIMSPKRADFKAYTQTLALPEQANPIQILAANGGTRVTDDFEVFPKLTKETGGAFTRRFFLHGLQHNHGALQGAAANLAPGEPLQLAAENSGRAEIRVENSVHQKLGRTPRHLVEDLRPLLSGPKQSPVTVKVLQVNPRASLRQTVLLEMKGNWNGHEPMATADYQPLIGDA